jgi:hypothetical protein
VEESFNNLLLDRHRGLWGKASLKGKATERIYKER